MLIYYVVWYKFKKGPWTLADQETIPDSYESFPRMYETRDRAERFAAEFLKVAEEGAGGEHGYKTKVTTVKISPRAKT